MSGVESMDSPLVSVIITSMGKEILKKSIKSVLEQTYKNIEIIVVVDNNLLFTDSITKNVKVISACEAHNANKSRNIGIEEAKGEYIALLDDDDLWLPDKIKIQVEQMQSVHKEGHYFSYVQTALMKNGVINRHVYPKQGIKKNEKILNYFFGHSKGFIQCSSFFGDLELFTINKFNEEVIKHQDWDWLINAQKLPDLNIDFVPQILTYYTVNSVGTSVGTKQRWRYSEQWFDNYKDTVTEYAKSNFYSKVILRSLLYDNSLTTTEKKIEIKRVLKNISIRHSFTYFKSLVKIILFFSKSENNIN